MLAFLPDDAARVLATLLESDDLESLRSLCHATTLLHWPRPRLLVLPPSDSPRVQRLLDGLGRDGAFERLGSKVTVQFQKEWHAHLLLASTVCSQVKSIHLNQVHVDLEGETVIVIREQLLDPGRIDTMPNSLSIEAAIVQMTQLEELEITHMMVSKFGIASLSALTNLRKLVLEETHVEDLSCIRDMLELCELRVIKRSANKRDRGAHAVRRIVETQVPPLHAHCKLQILELACCVIESTADLIPIAGGLPVLKLTKVRARKMNMVLDAAAGSAVNVDEPELIKCLVRLENIELVDSASVIGSSNDGSAELLAKIPTLRVIHHPLRGNFTALASLIGLKELGLHPSTSLTAGGGNREDLSVLFNLPQLEKLQVKHDHVVPSAIDAFLPEEMYETVKREVRTFTDVLTELTGLKSLSYEGFIDAGDVLLRHTHLEQLTLGRVTPRITRWDWMAPLQSLRSLAITTEAYSDYSGIGTLTQLQSLYLQDLEPNDCNYHDRYVFLSKLVMLRTLEIHDSHIHDFTSFRDLRARSLATSRV